MPIPQTEGYFENPWYCFLEEPMLFPVLTLCLLGDTGVPELQYSNFHSAVTF